MLFHLQIFEPLNCQKRNNFSPQQNQPDRTWHLLKRFRFHVRCDFFHLLRGLGGFGTKNLAAFDSIRRVVVLLETTQNWEVGNIQ